jgi:hypothetical protein
VPSRFALLVLLAALGVAGAVFLNRDDNKSAGRTVTLTTGSTVRLTVSSSVAGTTTGATVTIPPQPTTTVPPLPGKHQPAPNPSPAPSGDIATQSDAAARQQLEAFLATRPELEPYEDAIWYSAHYSYSNITPKGLAGLVWCVGFRIAACDRANDAAAQR